MSPTRHQIPFKMVALTSVLTWTSLLTFVAAAALPDAAPGILGHPNGHGPRPPKPHQKKCKTIYRRRAWHKLSSKEKKAYLDAVVCLMNKPSQTGLEGVKSRFDDFIKLHQVQSNRVHGDVIPPPLPSITISPAPN